MYVPNDLFAPGIPKRRYFGDDKQAAEDYAKQLADSRKCIGGASNEFSKLTSTEQAAILTTMRAAGGANKLLHAAQTAQAMAVNNVRTVQAAVDECIEAKRVSVCFIIDAIGETPVRRLKMAVSDSVRSTLTAEA